MQQLISKPEVDEEEYFEMLPERTHLMLLAADQLWSPNISLQGWVWSIGSSFLIYFQELHLWGGQPALLWTSSCGFDGPFQTENPGLCSLHCCEIWHFVLFTKTFRTDSWLFPKDLWKGLRPNCLCTTGGGELRQGGSSPSTDKDCREELKTITLTNTFY